jgi:chorismate mutase
MSNKENQIIAGPCSVESKEQLFQTAQLLSENAKINLFRCGIWKPRSSPNSFEGIGEKALPWLKEIEIIYKIPVCIEIATSQHLEMAVKAEIKHFWIGARTSVNPFSVQELASASQGLDINIMIKNPISPDLQLWSGNFERFAKAGLKQLTAIYRGFSTSNPQPYRNDPMWKFLIEFKRLHKEIPVYCDPSHIAGKRKYIYEIAQRALFLDVDGLMIEVHADPDNALSDQEQQLSVPEFVKLMKELIIPSKSTSQDNTLNKYRTYLDVIDNELFQLLAKRFDIIKDIALYKKEHNIPILQIDRWNEVYNNLLHLCRTLNIEPSIAEAFLSLMHETSIQQQEKVIKQIIS